MFFKSKAQQPAHSTQNSKPPVLSHIDSPRSYPRATLFRVSGWIASDLAIIKVMVGTQQMQLSERQDVIDAHPNYAFAIGFSGLAREPEIQDQRIVVSSTTKDGEHISKCALEPNIMLSLSKQEKLEKLLAAFPDDMPEKLIEQSQLAEVSDADTSKFELLKGVLKCPSCGAIGVSETDGVISCDNAHTVETIDNAYIYLNAEMRAKHNIKSNIEPASRAQDPLAVALIGKFKDGLILDCGAGLPFQNYRNVVNFEIEKFNNTDVIGVGEELPFADQTFDAIFSFSVLEHVKDPFKCAAEIERVLKPGGVLYSSVPFLIPVHGYPHHYYNMTQQGLENLFSENVEILQAGVPISGHPLFTLNSVANIWNNDLSDTEKEAFKKLTLAEIMDDPAKLIEHDYCANLSPETQSLISCTNMILGHKK